jgi:signal peptidase I
VSASPSSRRDQDSFLSFLRELPVLLLVALLLAFLLRTFVVQVFYIPSSSMVPTLEEQDRIVVEKISYLFREPARGEVIVFAGDEAFPAAENGVDGVLTAVGRFLGIVPADARDFVKRVIGLPGDTVVIEDGTVLVNGVALVEPYVDITDDRAFGPYEVPEGSLFVLGDNRPNSADSRFSLGYVEQANVVGRAAFVLWPPEHVGGLPDGGIGELDIPRQPVPSGATGDGAEDQG